MNSENPKSWNELRDLVIQNDGVLEIDMLTLRNILGKGKLGIRVNQELLDQITDLGMGCFPAPNNDRLPDRQHNHVVLYTLSSRVGKLIGFLFRQKTEESYEELTRHMRTYNKDKSGQKLDEIRVLTRELELALRD